MFSLANIRDNFYEFQKSFFRAGARIFSFLYVRLYLIILAGFNLFLWLIVYFINTNVSQDLIILHYNVSFGVDLIGSVKKIFIIPLLSLIIILINTILLFGIRRHKDFKFIAHILLAGSIIVNIFLLVALISMYLINFR